MNGWHAHAVGSTFRVAGCLGLVLIVPAAWPASVDGQALFEKRCAACHSLPDIDNPPPEGWEQRLAQMAPLAKLKGRQKDAVLAYLSSHVELAAKTASLEEDKAFFEMKCSRCHSLARIFLEPLTDESRRHVVSRMQAKSGTGWLSDTDVERVLDYLSGARFDVPTPPVIAAGASADDIFMARCQACHTLERVSVRLGPGRSSAMDWSHVVSRMRAKAPQWMTDAEATQIIDYLQAFGIPGNGG